MERMSKKPNLRPVRVLLLDSLINILPDIIEIMDEADDELKSTTTQPALIPETLEGQSGNKGSLISSLSAFKPHLLTAVTGTVGVRAVCNSDARVFIASAICIKVLELSITMTREYLFVVTDT